MGIHAAAVDAVDLDPHRSTADRRARPTPMFSRYAWFGGRRVQSRRRNEEEGSFVDVYGSGLFLTVTVVAMLNFLDAFFTVLYLSYGGHELNPIVQMSLDGGLWWFISLKSVGIGFCLLFLTLTKNSLFSRVGLAVVFTGYLALLGWHAVLYIGLSSSGTL
jgi:Domain of unknown function (DUF5658)